MIKDLKNKRILITGITGFVGSHLAKKLSELGAKVYGISRRELSGNVLRTSIENYESINEYVRQESIEVCVHLAAEALVEAGQIDPYQTFKININGTLNILEIARKNNLERVIIASTSHVYGNNPVPFLEEYAPKPSRPYETSKTCTDIIAQSYADSFHLPVLIPRFVNIYGPGDLNFSRLVPKTMQNVIQEKPPTMWGGEVVRDYLYIDDAIAAYLKLLTTDMQKIDKNRIFNFGTEHKISVKNLIEKIIKLSGQKLVTAKIFDGRQDEILEQYVSYEKAKKTLHWIPQVALDEGIQKTLLWYKEYFAI